MVSPELLRRYAFFAGLSLDHIVTLAKAAREVTLETGQFIFHEEDELDTFYLVLEGEVSILIELPEKQREVIVNVVRAGAIFGWSGLLPPYLATASAKAAMNCRVVAFAGPEIKQAFERDPVFAYLITQRIAQVARDRLHELRIESLAWNEER